MSPEVRKAGGFPGSNLPSLSRCPWGPVPGGCGGGGEDAPGSGSALPATTARLIFLGGLSRSRLLLRAPSALGRRYGVPAAGRRWEQECLPDCPGCCGLSYPPFLQSPAISGALEGQSVALPHWRVSYKCSFTLGGEAAVHLGSRRAARRVGPSQEPRGDSPLRWRMDRGLFPHSRKTLFIHIFFKCLSSFRQSVFLEQEDGERGISCCKFSRSTYPHLHVCLLIFPLH